MSALGYVSSRGDAPMLDFGDVLLTGLAPDGGLYLPERYPSLADLPDDVDYVATAQAVMWPFVDGTMRRAEFDALVVEAYRTFRHPEVCPLEPLGEGRQLLELFHGPTYAFKDVALQLVGRLFDHVLTARGRTATILVATSGDTGSAAMHGCLGREALDCVVLFPDGRVSDVQRRQMTTLDAPNVHALAVSGTFDDCQDMVKAAFGDRTFRDEVHLSAMNSINWGRVMAQVVYYVTAARAHDRPPLFVVPSGNFGNVFAGWVAQQMGLEVAGFVVASNRNDILTRWLADGRLDAAPVEPTISPSMDIQVSSNLERLLFELLGRDGSATAELVHEFRRTGHVAAPRPDGWWGVSLDDDETRAVIRAEHERSGRLLDPHTAVGVGAIDRLDGLPDAPVVCLSTAHPAKFPDAVEAATGVRPTTPGLDALARLDEHFERIPADLSTVQDRVRRLRR